MAHQIVAAIPGLRPCKGKLTTEHPQSSYGLPVVVAHGQAFGSSEVLWVDGDVDARQEAARAGYATLSDEDSRWPAGYEAMEE